MQHLRHNTPSYTIYEYKETEPNKTVIEDFEEKHVKSQLEEVASRINGVEISYGNLMADYELNPHEDMLNVLWSLSAKRRDLEMQKEILSERMISVQKRIESANGINYNNDIQIPPRGISFKTIRPTVNSNKKSNEWSIEVYNYTRSRTLNKRKFVNPSSLLGESREIGQYNYTYFNDSPSEDIQIFEYPVEVKAPCKPPIKNAPPLQTKPSPINPGAIQNKTMLQNKTSFQNKTQPQNKAPLQNSEITQTQKAPIKKVPQTFPIQCTPTNSTMASNGAAVHINDIINRSVDSRHVIIIRGLPGSGKSAFCQAFKEQELRNGHSAPRILSIDHFFMEDGVYEYDAAMEPTYRDELFKLFKRQIDEGFFSVILIDSINEKLEQFIQFYHYARFNRFQPSILELKVSPTICAKRCEHKFNPMEIYKMADSWEETPSNLTRLDATSFLQDSSIEDVEMEDADEAVADSDESASEDDNEITASGFFKSKWDEDFEERKERLDGVKQLGHEEHRAFDLSDFLTLQQDDLYKAPQGDGATGKGKKVRWADFEELKRQKKRKELGFVAGYTDWSKIMSDDIDVAEAALVQVRYFVKDSA